VPDAPPPPPPSRGGQNVQYAGRMFVGPWSSTRLAARHVWNGRPNAKGLAVEPAQRQADQTECHARDAANQLLALCGPNSNTINRCILPVCMSWMFLMTGWKVADLTAVLS